MSRRLYLTVLCATALLAAPALAAPASAAGQSLGFNNTRQMVATGPNTFALVWVEGGSVVLGERRFGALAFANWTTVASGQRVSQPAIARRGDLLVIAWVDEGEVKARVRDGSRWLPTDTLGEGAAPSLAATRDAFGLVWHRTSAGSAVLFSRLGESGSWSTPVTLASGRGDTVAFASIAGGGQRFVAVWKRGGGGSGWDVELVRSGDSGRHWSRTVTLGSGADPAVCITGQRGVWVAHQTLGRIVILRSNDSGRSFRRQDVGEGWFAHLSCDREKATVAWEQTAYPPRHPDASVKSFGLAQVGPSLQVISEPSPASANVVAATVLATGNHRVYAWIDVSSSSTPLVGTLRVVSPAATEHRPREESEALRRRFSGPR